MRASVLLLVGLLGACGSSSNGTNAQVCPAGFVCTPKGDGGQSVAVDSSANADIEADVSLDAGPAEVPIDATTPVTVDATPPSDIATADAGSGPTSPDITEPDTEVAADIRLYAHTKDTLYVLNPSTLGFDLVGAFTFNKNAGLVTDIALDKVGELFAVTYTDLFACDRLNAKCTWLAKLPQEFNGLTFIPAGLIDSDKEVLVGIAGKGSWYRIDFGSGGAKLMLLGGYGGGWLSSGDAFSVVGVGTYATLKKCNACDNYLAEVDPATGAVITIIGKTGSAKGLFGLAWFQGVFYAVSSDGNVYMLDVKTATPTPVTVVKVPAGTKWWGAGVSTHTPSLLGG